MTVAILVVPSVTKLPPEADGAVVVGGSHAAVYAAHLVAKAGARAAIHHDAGIGLDEAGVGGLAFAEKLGMAMAAHRHRKCTHRRRRGPDAPRHREPRQRARRRLRRGARQTCADAAERLKTAPWPHRAPPAKAEGRSVFDAKAGRRRIVCIDSATLITAEDHDQVVATGSHGAQLSGQVVAPVQPALVLYQRRRLRHRSCRRGRSAHSQQGRALPAPRWPRCRQRSAMAVRPSPRAFCPPSTKPHTGSAAVSGGSALALARRVAEKAV